MARVARREQVIGGVAHEVRVRGNGGCRLFSYQRDYDQMVRYVAQAFARYRVVLHQVSVLWQEVRLVATPPSQVALSEAMRICLQRYAVAHHRRWRTSGRLFEPRFRATALAEDRVGDAILAADAAAPSNHPWTTAHLHAGAPAHGRIPAALWTPHRWYLALGPDREPRYRELLDAYVVQQWIDATGSPQALGR